MRNRDAKTEENLKKWPFVSVFVAARNEEQNLEGCLRSLQNQQYPGNFEVWIGNDHSTDNTSLIGNTFCSLDNRFHFLSAPHPTTHVEGKALALGCMANEAKGEIFLICDADMQMPSTWMKSMVSGMEREKVDMVNGTTATKGETIFSALQAIDWLIPQATFAWLSRVDITFTAMGNNMGITRKAYEATGGYLELPFSLTEDFELFQKARSLGFRLRHLYRPDVFGVSAPQPKPSDWLQQHIRWMVGFDQLPFRQQWVFYTQLLFYPMLVLSFFTGIPEWHNGFLITWGLKTLYNGGVLVAIRQFHLLIWLPLFEVLFWPAYISCWLRFRFSSEIKWKGRTWKAGSRKPGSLVGCL